ncbi:MAG: hypothetical protein JSU01_19105 [Bacteroidetes bacterium]|nr:hypothetical protein [Bacteroidota bacterium]
MKTTFTCCVITLFLLSCQKSSVTPVHEHGPISSHALQNTANAAFTTNQQADIDLAGGGLFEFNLCNGDILRVVSGAEHIDLHEAFNQNNVSIGQHANIQSLKLVSVITGAEYRGSGTSNFSENFSRTTSKMVLTETESVITTTPGGKNNSVVKFDLHETIDSNGNLTSFVDNFRAGCQ